MCKSLLNGILWILCVKSKKRSCNIHKMPVSKDLQIIKGLKESKNYSSRQFLLAQRLLPVIRNMAPEGCFIFQLKIVPAHGAREIIEMIRRDTPDCIPPTLRPPSRTDLYPVDYRPKMCNARASLPETNSTWCNRSQATFVGCVGGSGSEDCQQK